MHFAVKLSHLGLAMWIVVVLTAGAGVAAVEVTDPSEDPADGESAGDPTSDAARSADQPAIEPSEAQVLVEGQVTSFRIGGLRPDALDLPLVFEPATAGSGNGADLEGLTVAGQITSAVWDAGRPLTLDGDGTLELEASTFVLSDGVLRVEVGGTVAVLSPGGYVLDAPVAVGEGGLAEPRDGLLFEVVNHATVTFEGGVTAELPAAEHMLVGPGPVEVEGALTVQRAGAEPEPAAGIVMPDGLFELTVAPTAAGWTVSAVLEGDVDVTTGG